MCVQGPRRIPRPPPFYLSTGTRIAWQKKGHFMQRFVSLRILSVVVGGTALALTLNALPAAADSGAGKTGWFAKIDKNGDGVIDRSEFDASRQSMFTGIDTNGDKQISADEWKTAQEKMHQRMHDAMAKKAEQNSTADKATGDKATGDKTADATGDKTKQRQEHAAERSQKWFERMDTNKDGQISASEWQAAGDQRFARMDTDKDGKVSTDEMKARWHHKPASSDATKTTEPTQQ
jgi:Ca2+-binding EF-hand superfamily protein